MTSTHHTGTVRHSRGRARERGFVAHSTLLVGALGVIQLAFGAALLDDSPLFALVALLIGLVVVALLATAWMRPFSADPEHHPTIDKLFDDTSP